MQNQKKIDNSKYIESPLVSAYSSSYDSVRCDVTTHIKNFKPQEYIINTTPYEKGKERIEFLFKEGLKSNILNIYKLTKSRTQVLYFLNLLRDKNIIIPSIGIFESGRFLFQWTYKDKIVALIEFVDNKCWNYLIDDIEENLASRDIFVREKLSLLSDCLERNFRE